MFHRQNTNHLCFLLKTKDRIVDKTTIGNAVEATNYVKDNVFTVNDRGRQSETAHH